MKIRSPKRFEFGGLTILVSRSGDRGTVTWLGESNARNPSEFLNPLTETIVKEMLGAEVTIDFRRLQFMNSSVVPAIIDLVRKLEDADVETRVLFVDGDWQLPHLRCMKTITSTFKHVKVEGCPEVNK